MHDALMEKFREVQLGVGQLGTMLVAATPSESVPIVEERVEGSEPTEYIEIQRVKGTPGETVDVAVLGGSAIRIDGFWLNFGFKKTVSVQNVTLGDFFDEHAERDGVRHDDFRFFADPGFVRISYQMFRFTTSSIEGFEKSVRVPPDTELVTITFKLADDSVGTHIARHGGTKVWNRPTLFTTDAQVQPIRPYVENGGISI